jgi:hypothetical protein
MKIKKIFLDRVGSENVQFLEEGIVFLNFPMFLLPIDLYSNLIKNLESSLGNEKVRNIFFKCGLNQGIFAVDYFRDYYDIIPDEETFRFILEQSQSVGLGNINLISSKEDFSELTFNLDQSYSNEPITHDYYLEGLFVGVFKSIFKKEYSCSFKKINSKKFEVSMVLKNNFKCERLLNYKFKYISVNKNLSIKPNIESQLFLKLKERNSNLFYSDINGTFFNGEKNIFTLLSVFVAYYYFVSKVYNSKKILEFYQLGKDLSLFFEKNLLKANMRYTIDNAVNLFNFFGYGFISYSINSKRIIFKVQEGNLERISRNIFSKLPFDNFLSIREGFIDGLMKICFRDKKYEMTKNIIKKMVVIEFKFISFEQ